MGPLHSQDGGDVHPSLVGMLKATNGIDGWMGGPDGERIPSRWIWLKLLMNPAAAAAAACLTAGS